MRRLIERGVFRARRGSPNDDKHDHRAGAHGHARGAAGERAPQPSRPWRHDWDDPRSGHQLQQRPGAAQPGDDQSSQSRVDRRAELAPHHASVRRAKLHAPELQSLAHMSGVKSPAAPRPRLPSPTIMHVNPTMAGGRFRTNARSAGTRRAGASLGARRRRLARAVIAVRTGRLLRRRRGCWARHLTSCYARSLGVTVRRTGLGPVRKAVATLARVVGRRVDAWRRRGQSLPASYSRLRVLVSAGSAR